MWDLFRGDVRRTTVLTILVCSLSLTAHWAFIFWYMQQLRNLPDVAGWTDAERGQLVSKAMSLVMVSSIVGNFLAAALARRVWLSPDDRLLCLVYFVSMTVTYCVPRRHDGDVVLSAVDGRVVAACSRLFTMYMPPLFPTLLRTTGAGFCYNIGRIAAAAGTVFFGLFSKVGDFRLVLFYAGFLFVPAAAVALFLPEPPDEVAVALRRSRPT